MFLYEGVSSIVGMFYFFLYGEYISSDDVITFCVINKMQ